MKLHAYQLCRWCDGALHGRRKWLYLGANAALLALSALIGGFVPVLSLVLLANAVLALYLLHRHHAFGAAYQRTPRPQDALCETILIDAALIGQGTRLRAAAQPIDAADSLSLRLGSGALLLGTAMTLTADELPAADRAAILSAVHQLNIKPGRMRSHSPVIRREMQNDVTIVTVRDGAQSRRYYLGAPDAVAAACSAIWEGHPRPMTADDPLRIADTARYITQGSCRVIAWATALGDEAPIFLGMAGVGESLHLQAVQDITALRGQGLTVMLAAGDQPDTDLDAIRALLELPDHHARADVHLTTKPLADGTALGITRAPGDALLAPVMQLRQRFHTIEETLRRYSLLLLFSLLTGLPGVHILLPLLITALLLSAAIFIGIDLDTPRPRLPLLGLCLMLALAAHFFLRTQSAAACLAGGCLIAIAAAAGALLRLCGKGIPPLLARLPHRRILLPAMGALLLILLLLAGMLIPGGLLPMLFAAFVSAAILLLLLLEHRILR